MTTASKLLFRKDGASTIILKACTDDETRFLLAKKHNREPGERQDVFFLHVLSYQQGFGVLLGDHQKLEHGLARAARRLLQVPYGLG
jgi:hypothetical protein